MQRYLPKFVDQEIVSRIISETIDFAQKMHPSIKRQHFHVCVVVPAMVEDDRQWPEGYSVEPRVLTKLSFGKKDEWEHPYDEIAQCKAVQIWNGLNDGGSGSETPAHLLFDTYTPYWGGRKREGIVVCCSGVQPWFDQMISGMILEQIIAAAREAWENSDDKAKGVDFLTESF